MATILKTKTVTQKFRELKIGESLTIDCNDYSAPYSFARVAGIKIKTTMRNLDKTKAFDESAKYRVKVTRIEGAPKTAKKKTANA